MSNRTSRFVVLVQGVIAEVAMGGTLLVWLSHQDAARRALFGSVASKALLIAAMVAHAVALLALPLAVRLDTVVRRTCVMVLSLAVAGVGALAIGALFIDPGGPVILLSVACIFSALVVVAVSRAHVRFGVRQ